MASKTPSETMRAADFEPGGPEKMRIADVVKPELRDGEILIKVMATAINRADTLQVSICHIGPIAPTHLFISIGTSNVYDMFITNNHIILASMYCVIIKTSQLKRWV